MSTSTTEFSGQLDATKPADRPRERANFVLVWMHLAVLALHVPVMLIYFRRLWEQPHYRQFFPFALAFFVFYVYWRLKGFHKVDIRSSAFWPNLFLLLSIVPLVIGNLIFDLNYIAIGLFFLAASLLGRIYDRITQLTLMPAILILLPVVQPPSRLDITMITSLQRFTSVMSSKILDLIGINHNLQGNTIVLPDGGQFLVEEACSGVQSLFTLLFCALAYSVLSKHGWFRILLMVVAAVFWAGFMNTVRVIAICVADSYGYDLASGAPHTMLGYACLILGIGLLFSTDHLFNFLFGVSNTEENQNKGLIARIKNALFPPDQEADRQTQREAKKRVSLFSRVAVMTTCALIMLLALTPFIRLGVGKLATSIFSSHYDVVEIPSSALDEKIVVGEPDSEMEWRVDSFKLEERENNSDWGRISGIWQLSNSETARCVISCDYPFAGFHELSVCYRGNGWKLPDGGRRINRLDDSDRFVEVEFEKPTGEYAFLVFSLFDLDGKPIEIPTDDILQVNFAQRAYNSFSRRFTKDYGPRPQSFQVQVFTEHFAPLTEAQKQQYRLLFVEARRQLKEFHSGSD